MAKTDLKDKNGNVVYPQTKTEYVYDSNGNTLEERLQSGLSDDWQESTLITEAEKRSLGLYNKGDKVYFLTNNNVNNSLNIYAADVVEFEKIKIKASSLVGDVALYVFADKKNVAISAVSSGYSSGVLTRELTVPEGAVKIYISENIANRSKSAPDTSTTKLYRKKVEGQAMASYNAKAATQLKMTDSELQKYYNLGAQKMDTYNLIQEKVGIICIGQSNSDNRVASSFFPATANINGVDIELRKSIPTCKFMKGSTEQDYDEKEKSFVPYNNSSYWSFDQVVYNAIANALGNVDFYVCKQTKGGTTIRYQYATSFCADVDNFKSANGFYSQLYHLKALVQRALELQPDIKFKAIIMHQGEGDGDAAVRGAYYVNLCRMIQWIRGLVGSPKLPFIFGSIPTNSTSFSQIVYDDMVRVATDLNDVYLVTMGDAVDWVDDQWHSGDRGLHFGANTSIKLADEMFKIMVNNRMLPKFLLDIHSIVSNGEATGATHQLSVTTISVPNSAVVQWSSSKSSVATVNSNGLVTIVGDGTCTINVALRVNSDQNALYIGYEKCKVTVTNFNPQQS